MIFKRIRWEIQCFKWWLEDILINPDRKWYSNHYTWCTNWQYGTYLEDDEEESVNFWIRWSNEDFYVTPKDSYYHLFKNFKDGDNFRCHWVWNSKKDKPEKIKDIKIYKKKPK